MIRTLAIAISLVAAPAAAQTPAPAGPSLALGTDIAAKLMPNGVYQRMMGGSMAKMMQGMSSQMSAVPLAPFLKSAGLPQSDVAKIGKVTLNQIMNIVDPAYQKRMDIVLPVMMTEMGKVMTQFEPSMREGLAQAYAAHFTLAQLKDIDAFLNTPSGSAFAAQNMTIATDPAVMQRMQAFTPTLIQAMPTIMEKAQAAAGSLPKPKTLKTLTPAERDRLAQLLGVPADKLKPSVSS